MNNRIGVYICHCGTNIADYVDVEKVKNYVSGIAGVQIARTTMFACSDSGQKEITDDIRNKQLDAIVVASCSPKLHLTTFRAAVERAGLSKYKYVHANIREQVSWAHSDNKAGATEKALRIVSSAIEKVRLAEALMPFKIPSKKAVAVLGAGVAGMRAAIELSEMGCPVTLIEKEHFIGGRTAQWDILCTTNETGREVVSRLYDDILSRDNIELITGAEVISSSGSIGDFNLTIKVTPRYVGQHADKEKLDSAIDACPVTVPDDFNFDLLSRKAIYRNAPGELPEYPVIDMLNCNKCGICGELCESVDFSQDEKTVQINVGSVLAATGFDPYVPRNGEFGYNTHDNVVTLPQFIRLIDLNRNELVHKGRVARKIAYIYCVGSRQEDGANKYCSRYCCTSAIHAALLAKRKFADIENYHFTRGVRTYGKQEIFYSESLKAGDIYLQSYHEDPPVISEKDGLTVVSINDVLTGKQEISVIPDLVVLVTGMVPRADNKIVSVLKIPRGRDNFFNEIHMKLRPVETVIDGITICGAAQGPKNILESLNSALSAAVKSFSYVSSGELDLEPIVATIDQSKCSWCGLCANACPYAAISLQVQEGKETAVLNNAVCKGCGMCLPVCPADAIDLVSFSNHDIERMIDALAE